MNSTGRIFTLNSFDVKNYGTLAVLGGSTFTVTAVNSYKQFLGATTLVSSGSTLKLGASGTNVMDLTGGRLIGSGTVLAGTVKHSSGAVAPGDTDSAPGTLTVVGNYQQVTLSVVMEIDIQSPSNFDKLVVNGQATLANGNVRFTLTANGSVTPSAQLASFISATTLVGSVFQYASSSFAANLSADTRTVNVTVSNPMAPTFSCSSCTNGYCVAQDQCECFESFVGSSCDTFYCDSGCVWGVCVGPSQCQCFPGFAGELCDKPAPYNPLFAASMWCDHGCMNSSALNYNPAAIYPDGSCVFSPCLGGCTAPPKATCLDEYTLLRYQSTGTCTNNDCNYQQILVNCYSANAFCFENVTVAALCQPLPTTPTPAPEPTPAPQPTPSQSPTPLPTSAPTPSVTPTTAAPTTTTAPTPSSSEPATTPPITSSRKMIRAFCLFFSLSLIPLLVLFFFQLLFQPSCPRRPPPNRLRCRWCALSLASSSHSLFYSVVASSSRSSSTVVASASASNSIRTWS
jgi:hypothetical protein